MLKFKDRLTILDTSVLISSMAPKSCKDFQLVLQVKSHEVISRKPIRRTTRSFAGCHSCKRKKIKCDETKIRCNNCSRSDLECTWPISKGCLKSENAFVLKRATSNAHLAPRSFPTNGIGNLERILKVNVETSQEPLIEAKVNEFKLPSEYSNSTGNEILQNLEPNGSPYANGHIEGQIGSSAQSTNSSIRAENTFLPELSTGDDTIALYGQRLTQTQDGRTLQPQEDVDLQSLQFKQVVPCSVFRFVTIVNTSMHNQSNINQGYTRAAIQDLSQEESIEDVGEVLLENYPGQVIETDSFPLNPFNELKNLDSIYDSFFFGHFANRFLPTMAQPHFHHTLPQQSLVLSAATHSEMLQEIFVACGASLVAFDHQLFRNVAQEKYQRALLNLLKKIKHGLVQGDEDWFFVAVQVLQTLCLRDSFGGANATRCAAHFSAAYKIIVLKILVRPYDETIIGSKFSPLEKVLIENFIFNYSITIFYCDHKKLPNLVPNPFDFFSMANARLTQMSYEDGSPHSSRMSMLAFQIAAKCSWLCRLRLPLNKADQRLHFEMLLLAETILFSLESVDFSSQKVLIQNTVSIAKVVLRSSIILIRKMLDIEGVRALQMQDVVEAIVADIAKPYNKDIIFPIWSLMIAASTALIESHKSFFKGKLQQLIDISKSKIALQVLNHLDGLWEIYEGDKPFEFLFDTNVLDQVCN